VSSQTALKIMLKTGVASFIMTGLMVSVAHAQEANAVGQAAEQVGQAAPGQDGAEEDLPEIVVTGSRITRPNLDSAVPIISIDATAFSQTGNVSIGDLLNDLPALRSTFSTGNSTRFIGTAGLNLLDLRGLGTGRTLVLVNGRRHVSSSTGDSEVDTNTIPTDLIQRVDVITGGNSAIYGSDAIAGVVNFVLKRDFQGVNFRAQQGLSSRGDAHSYFVSGTYGTNFAGGKGNIAIAGEYARQKDILLADRPTTRLRSAFVVVDTDPAGTPNGSDGVPDRVFITDARVGNLSDGGTVLLGTGTNIAANTFRFRPDGSLTIGDIGSRDFRPLANTTFGGDGSTLVTGQLQPDIERFNVNLLSRYEITEAFKLFFEAKFVQINVEQSSSPSFQQGGVDFRTGVNAGGLAFSVDNPFLTDQARSVLQTRLQPIRNLNRTAALPGEFTQPAGIFSVNRNHIDFGERGEETRRRTFRLVGGVEGTFNEDWKYELAVNYGQFNFRTIATNNRVTQRYLLAIDAVRNSAGQIVCRAQVDPANIGRLNPLNPALSQFLAADIAACVPINVFGLGAPSQAAIDYINTRSLTTGQQTQFNANGFISGDLSQLFSLPGGDIGFAFGGEYRREKASERRDDLTKAGGTFLNAIPDLVAPAFEVAEAFGELRIPLLKDIPAIKELTFDLSGRVSDYKGSTGTVYAYNVGGTYSPIQDIRVRANFGRSVRAPTISELFTPLTQNFANVADPCDVIAVGAGTATRASNCASLGIPANFQNTAARAQTLEIRTGGNPLLTEEKSDSFTIGAIISPRFIPGLTITADYFDIEVKNVISQLGAQQILNSCFDAPTLNNQFCSQFRRDPTTFFIVPGSLVSQGLNFSALKARGLDVDVNYRLDLDKVGVFTVRTVATAVFQRDDFPFTEEPNRPNQLLKELGDPKYSFNFSLDYKKGPLNLGYQLRFLSNQLLVIAENVFTVGGRPPQDADAQEFLRTSDVFYHAIRASYDINEKFNIYAGVDNLFDRLPPFGLTGTGAGSGIFDNRGRFFYIGLNADF
jgi:outer membrane receptor protein involved in Fe transport